MKRPIAVILAVIALVVLSGSPVGACAGAQPF